MGVSSQMPQIGHIGKHPLYLSRSALRDVGCLSAQTIVPTPTPSPTLSPSPSSTPSPTKPVFVVPGTQVYGTGNSEALDPTDGHVLWSALPNCPHVKGPVTINGMLYATCDQSLYAVTNKQE